MRRRYTRRGQKPIGVIANINVTPMVDLVLILLIIFMTAAPLATSMIAVQLPKTTHAPASKPSQNRPLVISLDAEGKLYLNEAPMTPQELNARLMQTDKKERVFFRADKALAYEKVIGMIDTIKQSGIENVALVTQTGNKHEEKAR